MSLYFVQTYLDCGMAELLRFYHYDITIVLLPVSSYSTADLQRNEVQLIMHNTLQEAKQSGISL